MVREGAGRTAVYRTTEAGDALVGGSLERHQRAYLQDSQGRGWDGRWHLAAFAIPEAAERPGTVARAADPPRRRGRDQRALRLAAPLGEGRRGEAAAARRRRPPHGREQRRARGRRRPDRAGDRPDALAGRRAGRRLRARSSTSSTTRVPRSNGSGPTTTDHRHRVPPRCAAIVVAFQEFFDDDPLLPPELLPRPWPGRSARELLLVARRLGVRLREEHERPALFRNFDDLIGSMP